MRKRLLAIIATAAMLVAMIPSMAFASGETVLPSEMGGAWGGATGTTVYYNGAYYNTLVDALKGVYMSSPSSTAEVYCKPGADVGTMTHGHVADSITIYGNGATVSGGEKDLEVDTYKYDRSTGNLVAHNTSELNKDITVTVKNLTGIAVWGQRYSDHTINVVLQDCENVNRVYISGTSGKNNITIKNCGFDSSSSNCTVYSNATGSITVDNCTFENINEPININTKATSGDVTTTVKDCTFTNCGAGTAGDAQWAAPIRVVNSGGAEVALVVDNCEFEYTGTAESANGDILIGDGREGKASDEITATVENTEAEIQVQQPGYYGVNGVDADKVTKENVAATEKATVDVDGVITVTANTTPSGTTPPEASPATGDNSMAPFAVAGLVLAAMAAVVATRRRYN